MTTLKNTAAGNGTKTARIIYWIFTAIIFIDEGVGALWYNSSMAVAGMRSIGFEAAWFRHELGIGKIIGSLLLILPFVPVRFKEWAYVGFGISTLSALIGNFAQGTPQGTMGGCMAIVVFIFLLISYIYFHKTYAKGTYPN